MSVQPKPDYRFEDYLAVERESRDEKYEYVAGQVYAMTGASFNHNLITTNVIGELRNRLKHKSCSILANDMRLRIEAADACVYPDVMVLCDSPAFHDQRRDVLSNPVVVIEVITPSTEGYDRGSKFGLYRTLPSLRHYVPIAQDRLGVDVFTRQAEGHWLLEAYDGCPEAEVALTAIGCILPVSEIYANVDLIPLPGDQA
jgi:Uma2 family endonuclease